MGKHDFCRALLRGIMADVKKHVPVELRKEAWAYMYSSQQGEFQIPSVDFYTCQGHCCKSYTKYLGWSQYLTKIGVRD